MKKFKVWFTYEIPYTGFNEDYLIVEASSEEQAYENVMKANSDMYGFDVQSVEAL